MTQPAPILTRRLLLALLASLALHGAALIGRTLELPEQKDLVRLEARLVRTTPELKPADAPPPPPPKRKPPKKPREAPPPPPTALPEQPPTLEAPPPEPPAPPEPAAAVAEAPPAEAPPVPPADKAAGTRWPRVGRIVFNIYMGEQRFQMGRTTHQWEVADDGRYRISALSEPTGVALIPWFKPDKKLWVSTGRVTDAGLQPESFVERSEGKMQEVRADLDWNAKQLSINGGLHVLPLPEKTQDLLSFMYQLGYPGAAEIGELPVTTGRKMETYRFETVGEENLELPFGMIWRTLHVRARYGTEQTDLWLALEQFGLPVQIRTADRKGVVYYLIAIDIRVAKDAVDAKTP